MKLVDQVCSLELAKKLKELGVKQESLFVWVDYDSDLGTHELLLNGSSRWLYYLNGGVLEKSFEAIGDIYSAFTVAELGEMLPDCIRDEDGRCVASMFCTRRWSKYGYYREQPWYVSYGGVSDQPIAIAKEADTEANARAKMLIWLIENGKVKV